MKLLLHIALALSALTVQAQQSTLAVDGRTSANPSISAQGQFVAVAWSAATTSSMDIFLSTSHDGGVTFSAPAQVNAVAGDARVSGELPPRVALVPRKGAAPEIIVVWTAKSGTSTRLLSARSLDGGKTFGASTAVPGSTGEGSRGWQSVAVGPTGRVFVLWLDHRESMSAGAMHHQDATMPAPKIDPTEKAALSQLYFSSLDGTNPVRITRSVCYCCKTSLVSDGGNVYAAWRHVYPGSQRDIAFSMSRDGGKTFSSPVRVSDDHWQIDGCPENGPAIAIDAQHRAHVAWPTPKDGKDASALALFYAVTRDGRTFSPRAEIPTHGPASHVQMVLGADGPLVAWDEIVSGTRRLAMTRIHTDAAGKATFTPVTVPDAGAGQWYPVLATTTSGTVAAWVRQGDKGGSIGVARLR
ncbi:MAG: hypothetical protein JWM95_5583 [Gemmatimonadetes bacterium]|nr:hypothetical protein [Gemmatimonadota bacterium]